MRAYARATTQEELSVIIGYFESKGFCGRIQQYNFIPNAINYCYVGLGLSCNITVTTHFCESMNNLSVLPYKDLTDIILNPSPILSELDILEQQLVELQATVERMKKGEEDKKKSLSKWEPREGRVYITNSGIVTNDPLSSPKNLHLGTTYVDSDQACDARDQMRKFNRLLEYVAEFDVDENGVQWKADWSDTPQQKYYIQRDHSTNGYAYNHSNHIERPTVYMSLNCVQNLVKKLNSGKVVL